MGSFVTLKDGERKGQVKCLNLEHGTVEVGDIGGLYLEGGITTFSIALREGGYANFTSGKFTGITDEWEHGMFLYDKWGNEFDPNNPPNGMLAEVLADYGVSDPYVYRPVANVSQDNDATEGKTKPVSG